MIEFDEEVLVSPGIKVLGVGKVGCKIADSVYQSDNGIDVTAIDTDADDLKKLKTPNTICIGRSLMKGLGTGGEPELGRKAIYRERDRVSKIAGSQDLVFLLCGLGGGTGTAFAPFIAELAGKRSALTVAVVTKPFVYEGARKVSHAEFGLKELGKICDCVICAPNEKLFGGMKNTCSLEEGFENAGFAIHEVIIAICNLLEHPGIISLDFADIKKILEKSGNAVFGCGIAQGAGRAENAAENALNSPLMSDVDISSGKSVLISIAASDAIKHSEIKSIVDIIGRRQGQNIVAGVSVDKTLKTKIKVVVIKTGISVKVKNAKNDYGIGYPEKTVYVKHGDDELDVPTFLRKRRKR